MTGLFPAEANGGEPGTSASKAPPEGGGGVAAEGEAFLVEGHIFLFCWDEIEEWNRIFI